MRLLKWTLVHALHWAVLYGAFALNLDGAMYVLKFFVWCMAPLSLFLLADKAAEEAAKKAPEPVRRSLNWTQAWVTLCLLVWFGHIATALAWGVVMVAMGVHDDQTRNLRAAKETAASAA